MADPARKSEFDLNLEPGLGFFETLSRFETEHQFFGRLGGPDREPARLGQNVRMNFSTTDIARIDYSAPSGRPKVDVDLIGLLGPEGPMPYHITRWAYDRLSVRWFRGDTDAAQSDTAFIDFCDLLQHRMIALFYRAWADSRPSIQIERKANGRIHAMSAALAGLYLPRVGTTDRNRDAVAMRQSGVLGHQVHGPERLSGFLSECLGTSVHVNEFHASWMTLPKDIQTSVNAKHSQLGTTAVIGSRVFDRQGAVEIRVGPLTFQEYQDFLPGSEKRHAVRRALDYALSREFSVTLRLVLTKQEIPQAKIGESVLGQTAWLAPKGSEDAKDYAFPYRAEPAHSGVAI